MKGNDGQKGERGERGATGIAGRDGHDGTGLTLKTFAIGQTYHKGNYVFASSSKDPTHDSMYIAEGSFLANKLPSQQLDNNHWVEFKAPEGKQGSMGITGNQGVKGLKGSEGKQGVKGPGG